MVWGLTLTHPYLDTFPAILALWVTRSYATVTRSHNPMKHPLVLTYLTTAAIVTFTTVTLFWLYTKTTITAWRMTPSCYHGDGYCTRSMTPSPSSQCFPW